MDNMKIGNAFIMHGISLGINTEADGCICLRGGELGNENKVRRETVSLRVPARN